MRGKAVLEWLTSRHLVLSTAVAIGSLLSVFSLFLVNDLIDLEALAQLVDIYLKTAAAVIGLAWTLNRYFTTRTDALQIRVDADVASIPAGTFHESPDLGLLIARLDVVNTGKSLVPRFEQVVIVDDISPSAEGVAEKALYRWPPSGLYPGGPIEPGSWSAVNFALPIPASTAAVRLYLELHVDKEHRWTWHKTFKVDQVQGQRPTPQLQRMPEVASAV